MEDWPNLSILASRVQSGELKAVDLIQQALAAAKANSGYDALISTLEDSALKKASVIDETVAAGGKIGRLAGVPFIAKDNFLTFGSW